MTIVDAAVLILRLIAAGLAAWNVTWTISGARELMRGRVRPPEIYLSVVFWFSVAVLTFQCSYLAGQTPNWRLLAYTLLAVSMGLAAVGHRLGATLKARQFYSTWDHLGVATAMVDLAKLDPAAAERVADECRRLTAQTMVNRNG